MGRYSEMHIALQDHVINITHQAEEGELSHLDALIEMRKHKENFEKGLALIKDFESKNINEISNEANQYPEGYKGFEIKKVNGRTSFSYKHIPAWAQAEQNRKEVEEQYKAMYEAKLKGLPYADVDENGEVLPLPDVSYGKSYLLVKPKK